MEEKEEIIKMRDIFQKSTDILNDALKLFEELDKVEDEKKTKELEEKIEEKIGLFAVQMYKIQNL